MIALDLVIVTYNRLEKLKKTIQHYESQTVGFRNLIVVNNCSTDGTNDYLKQLPVALYKNGEKKCNIIIINTKENIGGAGGFYIGEKKAMDLKADWVFVADDDAYADSSMVEEFYKFIESHDTNRIAAVCAKVLNTDGNICLYHRDTHKIIDKEYMRFHSREEDYSKDFFSIDDLSYVGSFMNAKALRKVGLVNPDYFIYFDDSEHSIRLKKYGNILVVPSIKIVHEGGAESTSDDILVSWRDFYMIRNTTHMLLKHYPSVAIYKIYEQFRSDFHVFRTRTNLSEHAKMIRSATWSAFLGRLGKHKIYKPGWFIKK